LLLLRYTRFLVARKGNVKAAEEMIVKYSHWRSCKFPLKKSTVEAAFMTNCFFPYGRYVSCRYICCVLARATPTITDVRAKDGSPVVYMRGGLYDCNKATPEQFVLAAAYTIDWSLRQYPEEVNVTVIVHTVNVPNGPNQGADMAFIKLFTQVSWL
jgi:hypothetical protein